MVSVIVAVYNVQPYLTKCIRSIISQTYRDMEVILVDDGSTDKSGDICDRFARRDSRIRVIHKENGGVSSARNAGIMAARGEYIRFIDGDDSIPENSIELLVRAAEKSGCELIVSDYTEYRQKRTMINTSPIYGKIPIREYISAVSGLYAGSIHFGCVWNKLFYRRVIMDNLLKFRGDMNFAEDFIFNLGYLRCVKNVYAMKHSVYNYRVSMSQQTLSKGRDKNDRLWETRKNILFPCYFDFLKDMGVYEKIKNKAFEYVIAASSYQVSSLVFYGKSNEEIAEFISEIRRDKNISRVLRQYVPTGSRWQVKASLLRDTEPYAAAVIYRIHFHIKDLLFGTYR